MPSDWKPFSLYDEGGDLLPEKKTPPEPPEEKETIDLELVEEVGEQDEKMRQELLAQLGAPVSQAQAQTPVQDPAVKDVPFLSTGAAEETVEERTKRLIRERREAGKIRDRRKVASIFDKPIEPERVIRRAKAPWHPGSYRLRGFWFLFPALAAFFLFFLFPFVEGFRISLTDFHPLGGGRFVGFAHYRAALQDDLFWQTVVNATAFTLLSVILGAWPPLFLAAWLNELGRGKGALRLLFLLPFVIPAIPAANLWKWLYDTPDGVLNVLWRAVSGSSEGIGFLTDPKLALISITLVFVWKNFGWFLLIYYAVLQNLPEELYEAAELDGAGLRTKFFHITLPHLWPIFSVLVIIQVLTAFQIFTEIYAMTGGGPMRSTEVLGTYIYETAFHDLNMGYAAAMAMLMFAALAVFSAVRVWQLRRTAP